MSRALGSVLGLVAAGATAALFLELRAAPPALRSPLPTPIARPAAAPVVGEAGADQVELILAHPLFNPSRRPAGAAVTAEAGVELPRLAGIVIDQSGRSAIFAAAEHAKPLVVREGGKLGGWSVRVIETSAVTLAGPDGTRVLHPGFAKQAAPEPARQPVPQPRPARSAWAGDR